MAEKESPAGRPSSPASIDSQIKELPSAQTNQKGSRWDVSGSNANATHNLTSG